MCLESATRSVECRNLVEAALPNTGVAGAHQVVNAALGLATHVAKTGLGEKTVATGVSIVVGDGEELKNGASGTFSFSYTHNNKYYGLDLNVLGILASENKEALTFVLPGVSDHHF